MSTRNSTFERIRRPDGAAEPLRNGFTLIELLAVLAIGSVLVMLVGATASGTLKKTETLQCLAKMRTLGAAAILYGQDHNGAFPRSIHSAYAAREKNWVQTIAPYVGDGLDSTAPNWKENFNRFYRCPADAHTSTSFYSYGFNVYFELNPGSDDYVGSPTTWRKIIQVPHPAKTILLAEASPIANGDHLMCHMWESLLAADNDLDGLRHGKTSNYLFVDGHAESLRVDGTFDPAKNINRWNPSLAGGG